MKVSVTEYENFYHIDFTPETLTDVNALLCMQINASKKLESVTTYPSKSSGVGSTVVLRRNKRVRYCIK